MNECGLAEGVLFVEALAQTAREMRPVKTFFDKVGNAEYRLRPTTPTYHISHCLDDLVREDGIESFAIVMKGYAWAGYDTFNLIVLRVAATKTRRRLRMRIESTHDKWSDFDVLGTLRSIGWRRNREAFVIGCDRTDVATGRAMEIMARTIMEVIFAFGYDRLESYLAVPAPEPLT